MNTDKVTDADLLREAMNTVGKKGKLGEQIKCVVSVSMLSEGWDAKRVTHILGVRAFSTQLLCEQVVGRGLRRSTHDVKKTTVDVNGEEIELETFPPEYAEVYGVPFSFIPATGSGRTIPRLPVKVQKVNTVKNMWVPAVNNADEFGEWTFLEITDPWDMQNTIREFMSEYAS